jgi:NADH-quinone oxidoreductase subunit J
MLSRQLMSPGFRARNEQWLGGLLVAIALFAVLVFVLLSVTWPTAQADVPDDAIVELGKALVQPDKFVLPFEVASVLLLVALVGSVIIAREK